MSPTLAILAIAGLAALCIGALGFFLVGGDNKAEARIARLSTQDRKKGRKDDVEDNSAQRRKQVQDSLKSIEEKQKELKKKANLRTRIQQAGLDIEVRTFYLFSVASSIAVGLLLLFWGASPLVALGGVFIGGLGLPRWVLSFLLSRRQKAFLEEFANAIDVIVRGVKSGLPVNDCLRIIANEAAEPVRTEFRDLVEGQRIGVSLEQGLAKIYERMPLAEVNFFQIVVSIQQKSGGNLAEALTNLSKVLRDRKKMRAKIRAMSQEAKSSAAIIGSLPPGVMVLLYVSAPDYLDPLLTTQSGTVVIIGGLIWMAMGVMIMRKMINFNF